MTSLTKLLKTKEGREKLHSEIGDYKLFITVDDIHKVAPALLFFIENNKKKLEAEKKICQACGHILEKGEGRKTLYSTAIHKNIYICLKCYGGRK